MTFERSWMLLFACLPLAWFALRYRTGPRRVAFGLKAVALAAILAAVAEPGLRLSSTKTATAVLVDTSASVSDGDLSRASGLARSIENARGRNWLRILPFARSARTLSPGETARFERTAGEAGKTVYARETTVVVKVDAETGRPLRLSAEEREAWAPHVSAPIEYAHRR